MRGLGDRPGGVTTAERRRNELESLDLQRLSKADHGARQVGVPFCQVFRVEIVDAAGGVDDAAHTQRSHRRGQCGDLSGVRQRNNGNAVGEVGGDWCPGRGDFGGQADEDGVSGMAGADRQDEVGGFLREELRGDQPAEGPVAPVTSARAAARETSFTRPMNTRPVTHQACAG